jgi:hypothetical protein
MLGRYAAATDLRAGQPVGTRTRGFADYRLSEDVRREPLRLASLLSASTPPCLAVEQYWRAHDPWHKPDPTDSWSVFRRGGGDPAGWWFEGPGRMGVLFGPSVAEILSGARWRGFLSIPPLRQAHLAAFVAIGRAVGATGIIFVPDYAEELAEAATAGRSFDECLRLMDETWGPVQGEPDEITKAVVTDCERCPPRVWYLQPV